MVLRHLSRRGFTFSFAVAVRGGTMVEALERRRLLSVTTLTPVADAEVQRSGEDAAVAEDDGRRSEGG